MISGADGDLGFQTGRIYSVTVLNIVMGVSLIFLGPYWPPNPGAL